MALPSKAKLAVIVLFTPLLLVDFADWLVRTIQFRERWECRAFRADAKPSIKQEFLFFTTWASWLTMATFLCWSISSSSRPENKWRKTAQKIFCVALPHVCSVVVAFFIYIYTMPDGTFENDSINEKCHFSIISKEYFPERTIWIDLAIALVVVGTVVSHVINGLLMLLLLFSGELEYDSAIPYSTLFMFVLGLAVGIADTLGSPIYAGNNWVWAGGMVLGNLLFHFLFVLWHRKLPAFLCRCRCTKTLDSAKDATEKDLESCSGDKKPSKTKEDPVDSSALTESSTSTHSSMQLSKSPCRNAQELWTRSCHELETGRMEHDLESCDSNDDPSPKQNEVVVRSALGKSGLSSKALWMSSSSETETEGTGKDESEHDLESGDHDDPPPKNQEKINRPKKTAGTTAGRKKNRNAKKSSAESKSKKPEEGDATPKKKSFGSRRTKPYCLAHVKGDDTRWDAGFVPHWGI